MMTISPETGLNSTGNRRSRIGAGVSVQCALVLLLLCAQPARTAPAYSNEELQHLADLSIEELMEESITSVSKKDQKLGDAAAAVTVLSGEELRRAGVVDIADALRLVPGMNVGSYNAHQWAVSARGFNHVYANKLLVMVDGRTVYTPLFSGVFWDLQQVMIENVERIEVIRGPGATVWGANAVNGVINIITRDSVDTQGGLAYAGGGDVARAMAGASYGGKIDDATTYRVSGSYRDSDNFALRAGETGQDEWSSRSAGFRIDRKAADTQTTWQGDFTGAHADDVRSYDANMLGRWSRFFSVQSNLEVQAYFDRVHRDDQTIVRSTTDTFDLSLQQQIPLANIHDLIWGTGYRLTTSRLNSSDGGAQVLRNDIDERIFNAFVQDELTLIPERFSFTAGLKLEHNDFSGFEWAPSIRATFKPEHEQTVWAAVSRAVRTPSIVEGTNALALPLGAPIIDNTGIYLPVTSGNTALKSETLRAYELGYRFQPSQAFSLDLATYYNDYDRLITLSSPQRLIPGTPTGIAEYQWTNGTGGQTYGSEIQVKFSPSGMWRLTASYALLITHLHETTAGDPTAPTAPRHQANLGVASQFNRSFGTDIQFRYVSAITGVPSYITADLQFTWRLTDKIDLALIGRNLFDKQHAEQTPLPNLVSAEVPRNAYLKIRSLF